MFFQKFSLANPIVLVCILVPLYSLRTGKCKESDMRVAYKNGFGITFAYLRPRGFEPLNNVWGKRERASLRRMMNKEQRHRLLDGETHNGKLVMGFWVWGLREQVLLFLLNGRSEKREEMDCHVPPTRNTRPCFCCVGKKPILCQQQSFWRSEREHEN